MFFEFVPVDSPRQQGDEAPARMRAEAARRWAEEEARAAGGGSGGSGGGGGGADSAQPRTLLAHELEAGREYELVVSNLGGLCRYRLGDVVRVAGFHHAAPVVEFRYRIGQLLNLRGEKTSEEALSRAVRAALPAASVAEFSAAEIGGECTGSSSTSSAPPHYLVLVEAARDQPALPADAAARLEAALRDTNPVCIDMDSVACLLTTSNRRTILYHYPRLSIVLVVGKVYYVVVLRRTILYQGSTRTLPTTTQGGATRGQPRVCRLARQGRHRPVRTAGGAVRLRLATHSLAIHVTTY